MALERTVIRHLYGRPLETLLATWGISLMLIQAVRLLFGAQNVEVANPAWLSGGIQLLPNLVLPYNRIVIIAFALAVVLLTWLLLNKTRLGLNVRAVTQNRNMAACCGVPTGRVDMLAFGLGSGIAGLGGVALSQIGNVGPDLGQSYIIDSFMVVVLGGVGQLAGSLWPLWPGHRQQAPGAADRRGARQDPHPCADHSVHPEASARPVRPQGTGDRLMNQPLLVTAAKGRARGDPGRRRRRCWCCWPCRCCRCCRRHALHVSAYTLTLVGKILCYAIVALALDLVWGYRACCRWATACSSPWAATPWACT
jgi:hypothetical protein